MAENNVVLLTGASSGIGEAAARLLNDSGYMVYGTSRKPEIPPAPGIEMLELEVREDDSVEQCVETVIDRAGRIDVLVNNAGYAHRGPLEDVTIDEFRDQFETNLYGVHRMVRAVLPQMFRQGGGRIVNISSAIGRIAVPYSVTYCSSKFALEGYSEGLAKELAPLGIEVVIMEPGLTDTPFHKNATKTESVNERYRERIEAGRAGLPERMKAADSAEDVARVILAAVRDEKPALRYLAPMAKKSLGVE